MVTLSFFKYQGFLNRWWALKQMGTTPKLLKKVEGLQFSKLLGSGGKQGFSILPNFGLYSLLCVWNDEPSATHFFTENPIFKNFQHHSSTHQTIFLKALTSHGKWDGVEPFNNPKEKTTGKIAIITRAKIKLSKLWQFWRFVRPVSKDMYKKDGLIFSVGIGELPLIQQATFSIWESTEKMMEYAYKDNPHRQVIQKTRELGWYREELFARFSIVSVVGEGIISLDTLTAHQL